MLQVGTITYLMITDNICIVHCLHWVQRENRKCYVFRGLYTPHTADLHKGTNPHTSKILSEANITCAANILRWASQKTWVHRVHCLQEKIERPPVVKTMYIVYKRINIMLQVGTITYLMITDNNLILHLEIMGTLLTLGTKGK